MTTSRPEPYSLSDRDKTPNASGWGHTFHHTNPQRHIPCVLGDMLCPASADDIAPISPEALVSVQQALNLLANLVGDRDLNLFLANSQHQQEMNLKARDIQLVAKSLTAILRTTSPEVSP